MYQAHERTNILFEDHKDIVDRNLR